MYIPFCLVNLVNLPCVIPRFAAVKTNCLDKPSPRLLITQKRPIITLCHYFATYKVIFKFKKRQPKKVYFLYLKISILRGNDNAWLQV